MDVRRRLYEHIVISGGSSMYPGAFGFCACQGFESAGSCLLAWPKLSDRSSQCSQNCAAAIFCCGLSNRKHNPASPRSSGNSKVQGPGKGLDWTQFQGETKQQPSSVALV